jgi:DNA-directed RNA polymerase subunit K/omega
LKKEEDEVRGALVKYEKEKREAELVMRIAARARKSAEGGTSSTQTAEKFALPAEIAVQQFELNLRNYRRNAENYAPQQALDAAKQTENVSVRAKVATESQVTASILDGLSRSLMRLDPPKLVMATLRAAEAQLIRSRLEHVDDQSKGLSEAAANAQVTKLGPQGSAQMLWKETFSRGARKMMEDGPQTAPRTFIDD